MSLTLGFETGLTLLTLLGIAAAVAGIAKPTLGALGVAILCTLDSVSRGFVLTGGLLRWNTFNYLLLVVILLRIRWLLRLRDPQIRILQVFAGLLVVELAFSDGILGGMQHILNLVAIFGLLTYFARIVSARDVWYWSAMVGGVVSGLGSLIFFLQQGALPEFNENAWSLFPLTSLFTACVYFARPAPWINPRLLVMLAFVNALWVFLSGSRGSMAICAVCLAFIVVQLRYAPGRLALIVIGAFAVMGIANQFKDLGTYAAGRVLKLFDSERSMSNKTSGRWDIAEEGWRIFVRNPFGIGTGGFGKAYAALEQPQRVSSFRQGREIQAHSGWIKVLVENGVPGILCFGGFVFSFAARGWMRRSAGMLLPGLLVTLALSVAFVADEFQCKGLWYLSGAVILFFRRCHGRASSLVRSTSGLRREGLRNGAMALENRQARR